MWYTFSSNSFSIPTKAELEIVGTVERQTEMMVLVTFVLFLSSLTYLTTPLAMHTHDPSSRANVPFSEPL